MTTIAKYDSSLSTKAACRKEAVRGYNLGLTCLEPWSDDTILWQLRGFREEARRNPGFAYTSLLAASLWAGYYAGKKARK